MNTLDCRAQKCPHPVVETRKALLASPGAPLKVLVGDSTARENVSRLASGQGYAVQVSPAEGGFALELTPEGQEQDLAATAAAEGETVVFVSSETLGGGSEELGRVLLRNFIITLNELERPPEAILFVNAGVKLTCTGSEALEALDKLACQGSDIASCGLCLEYYGLKDQLQVGRATNMLDIVERLTRAGRVIRP